MKRISVFLLLISTFSLASNSLFAQGDYKYTRASLKGLDSVIVLITVDEDLKEYIQEAHLQRIVELELRKAGITIVDDHAMCKAMIIVSIWAIPFKLSQNVVSYSAAFSFRVEQPVFIAHDTSIFAIASTWSYNSVAQWGTDIVARDAENETRLAVEFFHNAYLAANGKK